MATAGTQTIGINTDAMSARALIMTTGTSTNAGMTTINAIIANQMMAAVTTKAAFGSRSRKYTV